jgi:hypothetical protein
MKDESFLPIWITDLASISSLIGLVITSFLLWEAKKIRNSFLRRARLPEVIKNLSQANNKISKNLKDWEIESRQGIEQFTIAKGLLENLQQKLPEMEKKKVVTYIRKLEVRELLVLKSTITEATEDEAWGLYTELSGLITSLKELQKDSHWN